jgi:TfoX/Sxy family transcriptional regulator of competence genes
MAYDESLAARVRVTLRGVGGVSERKMFGGLAFLIGGRMCCGIVDGDLMVRVPKAEHAAALGRRHVRPMDFTGRPVIGFVYVSPKNLKTRAALESRVARGTKGRASVGETQAATSRLLFEHERPLFEECRRPVARGRTPGPLVDVIGRDHMKFV